MNACHSPDSNRLLLKMHFSQSARPYCCHFLIQKGMYPTPRAPFRRKTRMWKCFRFGGVIWCPRIFICETTFSCGCGCMFGTSSRERLVLVCRIRLVIQPTSSPGIQLVDQSPDLARSACDTHHDWSFATQIPRRDSESPASGLSATTLSRAVRRVTAAHPVSRACRACRS
jgi:hypothetical protein